MPGSFQFRPHLHNVRGQGDRISSAANPDWLNTADSDEPYIDNHYGHVWSFTPQAGAAVYGQTDQFKESPIDHLAKGRFLRVPFRRVPVIDVNSAQALAAYAAGMHSPDKSLLLRWRGQNKGFTLSRTAGESQRLFGEDSVTEPSIIPSAARGKLEFSSIFETWAAILDLYLAERAPARAHSDEELAELAEFRVSHRYRLWAFATAQHYGLPSVGLDVTDDLWTAVFFALHEFKLNSATGHMDVVRVAADAEPVLYAMSGFENDLFDDEKLAPAWMQHARPRAQHAHFFGTGWGLAANKAAERIFIAFRLVNHEQWRLPKSAAELFPTRSGDDLLDFLLECKERFPDFAREARLDRVYYRPEPQLVPLYPQPGAEPPPPTDQAPASASVPAPDVTPELARVMPILARIMLMLRQPKAADWKPTPEQSAPFAWLSPPEAVRRATYFQESRMLIGQTGIHPAENPERFSILPFHPFEPSDIPQRMAELGFDAATVQEMIAGGVSVACPDLITGYYPGGILDQAVGHVREQGYNRAHCLIDPLTGFLMWPGNPKVRNCSLTHPSLVVRALTVSPALGKRFASGPNLDLCQGVDIARKVFGGVLGLGPMKKLFENEIPEIPVNNLGDLLALLDRLQNAMAQLPGGQLWLRGQTVDYLLPDRTALVKKWITPWSDIRDSSLRPNLYRRFDEHLKTLGGWESLVHELADWANDADVVLPEHFTYHDIDTGREIPAPTLPADAVATVELVMRGHAHEHAPALQDIGAANRWTVRDRTGRVIKRFEKRHHLALSAYMRGILLQHYGAPTAWLDITRDPKVGLWFALRKMTATPNGVVIEPHRGSGSDPATWPTIYVFPLIERLSEFLDSGTILGKTAAARPQRQQCGLLGGAGVLAQNYPSRYIGLKIRLSPQFEPGPLPSARELFPGPEEDGMLKQLLELEQKKPNRRQYPIYQVVAER